MSLMELKQTSNETLKVKASPDSGPRFPFDLKLLPGVGVVGRKKLRLPSRSRHHFLLLRGAARKRTLDHIITDRLPHGSVELHKTHLLDRTEISWPGVKRDTRERDRISVASQGLCLSHDVLAGEVIATLAQHLK